jgi:hypothetical protein
VSVASASVDVAANGVEVRRAVALAAGVELSSEASSLLQPIATNTTQQPTNISVDRRSIEPLLPELRSV